MQFGEPAAHGMLIRAGVDVVEVALLELFTVSATSVGLRSCQAHRAHEFGFPCADPAF